MFGKVLKSVSGIAKQATGKVADFRKVLDLNPNMLSLALPPQVSMGLKAANIVGKVVGVKVPTESELVGLATGKITGILGGLKRPVEAALDTANNQLGKVLTGIEEVEADLNSIDWLNR